MMRFWNVTFWLSMILGVASAVSAAVGFLIVVWAAIPARWMIVGGFSLCVVCMILCIFSATRIHQNQRFLHDLDDIYR